MGGEWNQQNDPVVVRGAGVDSGESLERFAGFRLKDVEREPAVGDSGVFTEDRNFRNRERNTGIRYRDRHLGCTNEEFAVIGSEHAAERLDDDVGLLVSAGDDDIEFHSSATSIIPIDNDHISDGLNLFSAIAYEENK